MPHSSRKVPSIGATAALTMAGVKGWSAPVNLQ